MSLLTIREVSQKLGISVVAVWYHVKLGRLRVDYLGQMAYVTETDFYEFSRSYTRRKYPKHISRA